MNRDGFPTLRPCGNRDEVAVRLGVSLLEILREIAFRPSHDLVLAGGSIVEGLDNCESDLDVYVLHADEVERGRKDRVRLSTQARKWIDIVYLSDERVLAALKAVHQNGGALPGEWGRYAGVPLAHLDLYHRLSLAVELNDPIIGRRALPAFDRDMLGKEVSLTFLVPARARWTDAVGAFQSRQFAQSAYVARFCLEYALIGYCALLGETNPSEKWLGAKLARLESDPISGFDSLMDCLYGPRLGTDEATAKSILKVASGVLYQLTHRLARSSFASRTPISKTVLERTEITADGKEIIVNALGEFILSDGSD